MQILLRFALAALSCTAPQTPVVEAPPKAEVVAYKRERGPSEVASFEEQWRDEARQREVPVLVRYPKGDGPFPVIVFSHGLGGTRENYSYLSEHWASWGYVTVHVQHLGSDDGVWRGQAKPMESMQQAASSLDNLINRPKDITFAIDELARRNAQDGWALKGKLDLAALGVAGHSFGAYTALCTGGRDLMSPIGPSKIELSDARVKACIAMSPQGHERERANGTWSEFSCPVFHMTGTKDESPISLDSKPEERRIPFDAIEHADEFLLIFEGGTHMTFGDAPRIRDRRDPAHHPLILASSTAFFDAYLKHDDKALAWLRDGGFAALLGDKGTFESKRARPSETSGASAR